ncbi:MAG: YfhO family protein [Planctomycetes bacterium]|nr:YfhO family protein [Planctomycetota bacterium]
MEAQPTRRDTPRIPRTLEPLRRNLLLLALPLLLLLPALLPGARFLPQAPAGFEPLAGEEPARAARAWHEANYWTGDRIFPCLTDQVELRRRLLAGESPTWEPRQGLGIPLFATAITGTLYPPNLLALLIEPELAAAPLAILALFLAGLGLWKFLELRGLSTGACAIGALCYQAGGFGFTNLHYPMKVDAALWLPWCLWAIEGLARGTPRSATALTVCATLPLLAGFPPIAFFVLGVAALYAALRLSPLAERLLLADERAHPRAWRAAALAMLAAVLLGALQIAPTWEASANSLRTERAAEDLLRESLPPATSAGLCVSGLFGSPLDLPTGAAPPGAWWWTARSDWNRAQQANGLEWTTFIGALTLVFALAGLVHGGRRAWFPLLLALGALGFAQGWPILRLLYHVPGLNLGAPSRALAVAWCAWPWLAALGAQAWSRGDARARRVIGASAALLAALGLLGWWLAEPEALRARSEAWLTARHAIPLEEVRAVIAPEAALQAAQTLRNGLCVLIGASLALAALALFQRLRGSRWQVHVAALCVPALLASVRAAGARADAQWAAPLSAWGLASVFALVVLYLWRDGPGRAVLAPLFVLVAAEALTVAPAHLAPRQLPRSALFPSSTALARIAEAAGADGRVLRYDASASGVADVEQLARPNLLHAYGTSDLTAYIAFTPRWYVEVVERMDPRARFRSGIARLADLARLDHPLLDLLRVRCVLSRAPLPRHERLLPLIERPGLCVYQRRGSMPVARIVPRAVAADPEEVLARVAAGEFDPEQELLCSDSTAAGDSRSAGWKAGELRVERPAPGVLDFEIRNSSGGWLVVSEQWYPGWRATRDGAAVPTLRANHAFRAYAIPPGDSRLHTAYAPTSLRLGALAAALGLCLLGWLAFRRA